MLDQNPTTILSQRQTLQYVRVQCNLLALFLFGCKLVVEIHCASAENIKEDQSRSRFTQEQRGFPDVTTGIEKKI